MFLRLRRLLTASAFLFVCSMAHAQISFTTAIGLALSNSPKVKAAEADVAKAQASLSSARDVYIPSVSGGSGVGPPPYGFPLGQPSIFNFSAQSLIFNYSQRDYIRASRAGVDAANLALIDAKQAVAEDAALTYLALDRDLQRQAALTDQEQYSSHLVSIVQDRIDAGQDTQIELTTARLTHAQIRLTNLHDQDETDIDRTHLARLIGLPAQGLTTISSSIPPADAWKNELTNGVQTDELSPGIRALYANAKAKQEVAFGDSRYEFRPQVYLGAQYSRFAYFNNYADYYRRFQQNNAEIGLQITVPVFDVGHRAKARESAAEAAHAMHDADQKRDQYLDGRIRLRHAAEELAARVEVADLDQQLAQQQLDAMLVQVQTSTGANGRPMTPKDEQNVRIAERQKYLSMLDSTLQLRQTQLNLMRQTGQLEGWLKSLVAGPQITLTSPSK